MEKVEIPYKIDDVTNAIVTVNHVHHEIHEGEHYLVQEGIQLNNASKEYLIVTPNTTKWAHIVIAIEGSQDTSASLVETTTKTGGTAMAEINLNRNSANTASVVVTHTPGGAAGTPTTLFSCQFGNATSPGGRGGNGGAINGRQEFMLKQNESYLLTVTALSANVNNICVVISWYEHTSIN